MGKVIYNLTQHQATPEQKAQGVVDLEPSDMAELKRLLTFVSKPELTDMFRRAGDIESMIPIRDGERCVMIGGAQYFMPILIQELKARGVRVFFAWAPRVSVETPQPDGTVLKTSVFRHEGFIEV